MLTGYRGLAMAFQPHLVFFKKKCIIFREMSPKTPPPIVNTAIFRRDVYFLSALLLADKKIAGLPEIRDAAEEHFDGEANRLLVLAAVSARRFMDINAEPPKISEIIQSPCGQYWTDYPKSPARPLHFRRACNSIIHADEIAPYGAPEFQAENAAAQTPESGKSGKPRIPYSDKMVILGKYNKARPRTELNCEKFVKCCIILSKYFSEK